VFSGKPCLGEFVSQHVELFDVCTLTYFYVKEKMLSLCDENKVV
jgi:hypothetical protein